jgi:hypothetical protein
MNPLNFAFRDTAVLKWRGTARGGNESAQLVGSAKTLSQAMVDK